MTDKNMLELEESIPSLTLTPELDAQASLPFEGSGPPSPGLKLSWGRSSELEGLSRVCRV